ncbi:hypothetical protein EYF80_026675 [Liparis tanakae]|uniref:Uncharacterized protein n=1 Tax=Liparis tanakae TaxID=230148 RepID=A0A4Z2HB61_9TELE|nr:hypothetical protein EYF80_026675 [Liparis tanakae]
MKEMITVFTETRHRDKPRPSRSVSTLMARTRRIVERVWRAHAFGNVSVRRVGQEELPLSSQSSANVFLSIDVLLTAVHHADILRASELARSMLAGVTARIRQLSLVMNCISISLICCSMSTGWSPTATLVIPGRRVDTEVDGDGGDALVGSSDAVSLCFDLQTDLVKVHKFPSLTVQELGILYTGGDESILTVQPPDEILQHGALPCALAADDRYLRQVQVAALADGAEGVLEFVDEGN